jgi:hypothetical protein
MDINEFVKRVQPRKKRSRLIPFADQIAQLKAQGYTDLQIRGWLAENGVEVSREAVRKFIKNAAKSGPQQATKSTTLISAHKEDTTGETGAPVNNAGLSQADKIRQKLEDQKRDADSKRFKHDKTDNH